MTFFSRPCLLSFRSLTCSKAGGDGGEGSSLRVSAIIDEDLLRVFGILNTQ